MILSRSWPHFTGLLLSLACVNKMEREEPTVLDYCLHLENYRYTDGHKNLLCSSYSVSLLVLCDRQTNCEAI